MKKGMVLLLVLLLVFTAGCDTELGHSHEDHDGDGIQDHAPEDHHEQHREEPHDEASEEQMP